MPCLWSLAKNEFSTLPFSEGRHRAKSLFMQKIEIFVPSTPFAFDLFVSTLFREWPTRKDTFMLILIDNYDSFTYNLVQYFGELGTDIRVFRNDQVTLNELIALNPSYLVISPGPGTPDDGGISNEAIRYFTGRIPVLGVCLGHQCLGAIYGGKVERAARLMHGKTSQVTHNGRDIFKGVPSPFEAMRYHSLIVNEPVPAELEVIGIHCRGRDHGDPPQTASHVRRSIPPRVHSHRTRKSDPQEFSGNQTTGNIENRRRCHVKTIHCQSY